MKKLFFLLLITNCSLLIVHAQSQFQRTIGGISEDYANSIIQTTDGGYAVAGYTGSFGAGQYDFYIVKFDGSGTLQWSKTLGGTGADYANSIIQTTDGGYVAAGSTNSFGASGFDMYIVKLNAGGALQWSKTLGGTNYDDAYSIIQTTDGGYAVAGYTGSFGAGSNDMYIVKLDSSGTLLWSKTIGGGDNDYARSIIQTTDGGYAVAGYTGSFGAGSNDMYIVKLDSSGTLLWSKTVGGTNYDYAYSIIQTTDDGYVVAGSTNSFGASGFDMYIVKLNAGGILQWSKIVGGTNYEQAFSITRTTDDGYAAAGYTETFGAGFYDMYIVKLDAGGNTCGNPTSPTSIVTTPTPTVTTQTSTVITPTPTVTMPIPTVSSGGTVTTICVIGIQPISNEIPGEFALSQNYPNPFNPKTTINLQLPMFNYVRLIVYDALGREAAVLVNESLRPGAYEVEFDGSKYSSGVYFYRLVTDEFSETKKMMLVK